MSGKDSDDFPNALEAFFVVIALFGAEYIAWGALALLAPVTGMDPKEFPGVAVVLGSGAVFSALMAYKGMGYRALFHPSDRRFLITVRDLTLPVLLLVPGMLMASWTIELVLESLFPMPGWQQAMFERMLSGGLGSILTVALLGPVVEEMLFRGIILRSFLHQYPRVPAILGSAFIFGAAHLNIYQFVTAFLFGAIAGWLYERSRSLWPCIVLHAAFNSASLWIWISTRGMKEPEITTIPPSHWMAGFLLTFFGVTVLQRMLCIKSRPVTIGE